MPRRRAVEAIASWYRIASAQHLTEYELCASATVTGTQVIGGWRSVIAAIVCGGRRSPGPPSATRHYDPG